MLRFIESHRLNITVFRGESSDPNLTITFTRRGRAHLAFRVSPFEGEKQGEKILKKIFKKIHFPQ